jgi:hypothetical protein
MARFLRVRLPVGSCADPDLQCGRTPAGTRRHITPPGRSVKLKIQFDIHSRRVRECKPNRGVSGFATAAGDASGGAARDLFKIAGPAAPPLSTIPKLTHPIIAGRHTRSGLSPPRSGEHLQSPPGAGPGPGSAVPHPRKAGCVACAVPRLGSSTSGSRKIPRPGNLTYGRPIVISGVRDDMAGGGTGPWHEGPVLHVATCPRLDEDRGVPAAGLKCLQPGTARDRKAIIREWAGKTRAGGLWKIAVRAETLGGRWNARQNNGHGSNSRTHVENTQDPHARGQRG